MDDSRSFQRMAAIAAIISMPLAVATTVIGLIPVNNNLDAMNDLRLFLPTGVSGARLWRWTMVLDLFSYYLLIVPLTGWLWRWLKPRSPNWMGLFAGCLASYSLIGSIGAVILAAVLPPFIVDYASAGESQRVVIETLFTAFQNMVYTGLWNLLEEFLGGIGWLGIGLILIRERRAPGVVTILLGLSSLMDSIGTMLTIEAIASLGLYMYLLLQPIWALWLGIDLLRKPVQLETT